MKSREVFDCIFWKFFFDFLSFSLQNQKTKKEIEKKNIVQYCFFQRFQKYFSFVFSFLFFDFGEKKRENKKGKKI
jgi:hypothetical protein